MERRINPFDAMHEDVRVAPSAAKEPASEPRTPKRTVRMRVLNFKPLPRPTIEEIMSALRSASPRRP